jgi:hypothetical protein
MTEHRHEWSPWEVGTYKWSVNGVKGELLRNMRKCIGCGEVQTKKVRSYKS